MTGHIFVYGEIGGSVTAKSIQEQIDRSADDYEIHISSPGGDVYEGYAIYGILSNLGKPKKVIIEGICASIATLIAQSGDTVLMTHPAEFMIHNPYVQLSGDASDLQEAAEQLNRIKSTIIGIYRKRTGLSEDELSKMMDSETWMTALEAKQQGFIDEVQEKLKAVAYINTEKIKMSKEKNSLQELMDKGFAELKAMIVGTPKNVAQLTLADGRVITVNTESGMPTPDEMVGATVVLEDGYSLEDGAHQTAEGVQINVLEGIIKEAIQMQPEEESEPDEVEALKAKVAELEAALAAKDEAIVENQDKLEVQNKTIKSFKASVEKLEAKYNELKSVTVGDGTPPVVQPHAEASERQYDPMADWFEAFRTSRR